VRKLAGGKRVENVEDVLGVGQKLLVKITKIDDRGKLSLEPVLEEAADQEGRAAASEGPEAPPKAECFVARR
jgi:polyribonucleotide nucleotidyltransferase